MERQEAVAVAVEDTGEVTAAGAIVGEGAIVGGGGGGGMEVDAKGYHGHIPIFHTNYCSGSIYIRLNVTILYILKVRETWMHLGY
jgi:hypothetical protein